MRFNGRRRWSYVRQSVRVVWALNLNGDDGNQKVETDYYYYYYHHHYYWWWWFPCLPEPQLVSVQ